MQTKPFTNMFGTEVQLTRDQFIDRWENKTEGFMGLFLDHGNVDQLTEFKRAIVLMAGMEWDKQ